MSSDAALRVAPRDRLLGELLLDAGLVGAADLERGLALQQKIGGRIGSVLMRIGAVSEDNLLQVLSRQLGLPVMGADVPAPDEDIARLTAMQAPAGTPAADALPPGPAGDAGWAAAARAELAAKCFDFLPTRARLDLAGWADKDMFSHD